MQLRASKVVQFCDGDHFLILSHHWLIEKSTEPVNLATYSINTRDVRGGAFSSGAGRGEDENPRGGPGQGGAKKCVNQLIQKFDKSA